LEIKISVSHRNWATSLINRVHKAEDRILGPEDKVNRLEHSDNNWDKNKKVWAAYTELCGTIKYETCEDRSQGGASQKYNKNIFNQIIEEHFPNLGEEIQIWKEKSKLCLFSDVIKRPKSLFDLI
jgi:hypothetical protein